MKRLTVLMITATMTATTVFGLTGCGKAAQINESEMTIIEDSSELTNTMYMGENGWSVIYDELFFNLNELTQGKDIELIYSDECNGSAYVELMEVSGRDAKTVIDEMQSEYESTSEIFDVKDETKTGFVFYVPGLLVDESEGDDRYTSVEVLDLKDGCLVVTASQLLDESMQVSDRISDVICSIETF